MAGISASDKARAMQLIEQLDTLHADAEKLEVPSDEDLIEDLRTATDEVREQYAMEVMRQLDVSVLAPCGYQPQPLHKAGYTDMAALYLAFEKGTPKGISSAAFTGPRNIVKRLHKRVVDISPCLIDTKLQPEDQEDVLAAVYLFDHMPSVIARKDALLEDLESLSTAREVLAGIPGFFGNLFMRRERREAITWALSLLDEKVGPIRSDIDSIRQDLSQLYVDAREQAWSFYKDNSKHCDEVIAVCADAPLGGTRASERKLGNSLVVAGALAQQAHDLADRLAATQKQFNGVHIDSEKAERERLIDHVQRLKEHEAKAHLDSIDIEILTNAGIRVGALKTAGFDTLGSLVGKNARQLCRYQRVTYDTARAVAQATDDVYASALETARCRFDATERPSYQEPLVLELYLSSLRKELRSDKADVKADLDRTKWRAADLLAGFDYVEHIVMPRTQRDRIVPQVDYLSRELPGIESKANHLYGASLALSRATARQAWEDFERNAASYYAQLERLGAVGQQETTGDLPQTLVDQVARERLDTSNLSVTLRGYQRFGAQYALHQKKVLIGDEMGLGKTVEAIATMAHLYAKGQRYFMVVCPLSVLINWSREVPKHSKLRSIPIHGRDRDDSFKLWCLHGGVAVTTYETVSRLDWSQFDGKRIAMLVADEAHYVKNPNAKRTKALVEQAMTRSDRALFLSGTPLENKVEEMNALIGHLNPQLVRYELNGGTVANPIKYRQAIAPVYLRRKREDVLDELPKKIEKEDWLELTQEDLRGYRESLMLGNFATMRRVSWQHGNMRQSAKAQRLLEICEEAKANGSKVLVFSFFLDTIAKVERLLGDDCIGSISGRIPAARRQQLIDDFSRSNKTVLASQVTAGGVGLNIQAASIIVFCEPQIKPPIEDQAISRSYRMGQVRTVVVHRLLMSNTVDERMEQILAQKRRAFDAYADMSQTGQESLGVVDTSVILQIIEEERKRYNIRGGKPANTSSSSSDGV